MINSIPRYGHISVYKWDILNWLPVWQYILYISSSFVWCCVLGIAPTYLLELFILISSCFGRQSLRSASRGDFLVPKGLHDHHTTYGFLDWYSLPSELRSLPRDLPCSSCKLHKTSFCPGLSWYWCRWETNRPSHLRWASFDPYKWLV